MFRRVPMLASAPDAAFVGIRGTWLTGSYYIAPAVPLAAVGVVVVLAVRRVSRQPAP